MAILVFFLAHHVACVFVQSFFLHRYSAHGMFTMRRGWERFFHLLTYVCMGSSYLSPRAYALLHREHHAFADRDGDPHSPHVHSNFVAWVKHTMCCYADHLYKRKVPRGEPGYLPEWDTLERLEKSWLIRLAWAGLYLAFYLKFATAWWQFALVPVHGIMSQWHGVVVNWFGHRRGYMNFQNGDQSRNTLPIDFLIGGELYQNNHHRNAKRANFAVRWFEIDFCYQVMRLLAWCRIIHLQKISS